MASEDAVRRYTKLKLQMEETQRLKDRLTGSLDQLRDMVRNTLGCETTGEVEKLVNRLRENEVKIAGELTEGLDQFESLYGDKL